MMTAIKAATAHMSGSEAADWFRKVGDMLDRAIPIALSCIAIVSLILVAFDVIH